MKRHQFAKAGQVILSEIWAKKGAIGIVPPEGESALITSHFFLFNIVEQKLLPAYMKWLLQGNYFARYLENEARGTTGYAAIRPKQFLAMEIPLPPLAEQQRIVARIEALAGKIAAARRLREEARKEIELITGNWTQGLVDRSEVMGWPTTSLTEVCAINPSRKGQVQLEYGDQVSFVPMQLSLIHI